VVNIDIPEKLLHNPQVGEDYNINIVIDVKGINDNVLV